MFVSISGPLKLKYTSYFKNEKEDQEWFKGWILKLQHANKTLYSPMEFATSLGKTIVYSINHHEKGLKPLVIFPGFRTTSLFWDLDNALEILKRKYRIYLVETNGQPNLSDGNTPEIRSLVYGHWAAEVLEKLKLAKATIAGASFGGLICMKLCIVAPEKIDKAILLNPGCLQPFSLSPKNLFYNILPIISPTEKNIKRFLYNAVLCKPNHQLTEKGEELIVAYQRFALTRYVDNTQKPYAMDESELGKVTTDTYLLVGAKDILFPAKRSIENAKQRIATLRQSWMLPNTAHGIETSKEAMNIIDEIMQS